MSAAAGRQEQIDAVEQRAYVAPEVVRAALVQVPPSWSIIQPTPSGAFFRRGNLQVGYSVLRYEDGRVWKHVSVCGRRGEQNFFLPSWDDVKRVKNDFIGADRWAYQVLPSEAQYVNHHPCVLHLFSLFEGGAPALPDFTWGLGSL